MNTSWSIGRLVLTATAMVALGAAAAAPSLQVGSAAPPLDLPAADGGARRSLQEIEGPAVLIFYRGLW